MRIVFAALLVLAGCGREDLCGGPEATGLTCLTVHVTGAIDPDATIDRLQVDVSYNDLRTDMGHPSGDVTQRFQITPEAIDGGTARLPIDFPIVFSDINAQPTSYTARILIVAFSDTTPVGIGKAPKNDYDTLVDDPRTHTAASVVLEAVHKDGMTHGCFNAADLRTVTKTGNNCGGDCPACPIGESCSNTTDCASPNLVCRYEDDPRTGTYHQFCQLP